MAVGQEHTVKAFDDEINQLRALIAQMGGLAEEAIADAMAALQENDARLATEIRRKDREIDRIESEVERLSIRLMALRAPMADDLRDVVAALKIAAVLERVGDYAKNIAKRVPMIHGDYNIDVISILPSMAAIASEMVRDSLDAFSRRDSDLAVLVCRRDEALDDFYDSIFRTLVTYMVENPRTISQVAHLLFVAKNLERIGDHATNVAEMVYFQATGSRLTDRDSAQVVDEA